MTSSASRCAMGGSIKEYSSFPNIIRFQLGKRKKEFNASVGDGHIISKADEAIIYGIGTPTGNTKIKLLQVSPESRQPNTGIQSYETDTRIFGIKAGIHLKRSDANCGTGNVMNKEKFDVGRSLDMLVEAIQLIEAQRLSRIVDRLVQGKDLISLSLENKSYLGRTSLQNQQSQGNHCLEASNKVVLDVKPSDARHNCTAISEAVDIDSRAMLRTRSREGVYQHYLPNMQTLSCSHGRNLQEIALI